MQDGEYVNIKGEAGFLLGLFAANKVFSRVEMESLSEMIVDTLKHFGYGEEEILWLSEKMLAFNETAQTESSVFYDKES